jgi:hypothetical protein
MVAKGVPFVQFALGFGALGLCLVTVVLDLFATAHYGLWKGLRAKKANRAFIQTILYILILPAVLGCFCYPVIGFIKNCIFINYSRAELRRQFRIVATQQFSGEETPERRRRPKPTLPSLPSVLER